MQTRLLPLLLMSLSPFAYAERDALIIDSCKQLNTYASSGAKTYQKKNYQTALKSFKQQAAWTHFCALNEDVTAKPISREQLATAYNNVGLTYAKLNQPKWARAWYQIIADSPKSQFNLKQLPNTTTSSNKKGIYVRYAGQGAWNTVEVFDQNDHYQIGFAGLRMGIYAMIYGPNMGDFTIKMPKDAHQVEYHYENCIINLSFKKNQTQEYIDITQNQADAECGFGFGVYADGQYTKVESAP